MSGTLAEPSPYDPLDRTRPDEPIFTVVGRDPNGPATVEYWSDLTRKAVLAELEEVGPNDPRPDHLHAKLRQCTEADTIAWEMRRFRKGHSEQAATPQRATYSGVSIDASRLDESARKEAIAGAVRDLREAAFHVSEARDKLQALGELEPGEFASLENALGLINLVADAHAPRRPGMQTALTLSTGTPLSVAGETEGGEAIGNLPAGGLA